MSKHRIKTIAALSAIALCVGSTSTVRAQASTGSSGTGTTQQSGTTGTTQSGTTGATSTQQSDTTGATSTQSGTTGTTGASTASASTQQDRMSGQDQIRLVTERDEDRTVSDFRGKNVTGTGGEELGTINDFVIDTKSGEVKFVVVATGGFLGIGDRLRLVKHDQLQQRAGEDGFTAQLDRTSFEALPVVEKKDLESGRIPSQLQQQVQQSSGAGATASSQQQAQEPHELQQYALVSRIAGTFKGTDVRSGTIEAGRITDVVIDMQDGKAFALFEAKEEFAGTDGRFVVPMSKFELGSPEAEVIATTLSRTDLSSVQATDETLTPTGRTQTTAPYNYPRTSTSTEADRTTTSERIGTPGISGTVTGRTTTDTDAVSTTDRATTDTDTVSATDRVTTDTDTVSATGRATTDTDTVSATGRATSDTDKTDTETLSPTGRESTQQTKQTGRAGTDEKSTSTRDLSAVTSSIRTALQQDTSLAREDVRVTSSQGRITLQGTVKTEEIKDRAEEVARRAAQNAQIDNQIKVQGN